jgi:predicted RNA-binding protein YlqC (UPF0109 family)
MMDYINAIHKFIDPIVNSPESIEITELPNDNSKDRTFMIKCSADDAGRLIGKHGATADALREVLSVAGKSNGERVHIKFTSLDANDSDTTQD